MSSFRQLFGAIRTKNQCTSFLPINRANEGRVDCYLFGSTLSIDEIRVLLPSPIASRCQIEQLPDSPEIELVYAAGIVVENLLTHYSGDQVYDKLFDEHVHYIMNSLDNDKLMEATHFLSRYDLITKRLIASLHLQINQIRNLKDG